MTARNTILVALIFGLVGCASTTQRGKVELNPGMTIDQVRSLLDAPDDRSFRGTNEAWQY